MSAGKKIYDSTQFLTDTIAKQQIERIVKETAGKRRTILLAQGVTVTVKMEPTCVPTCKKKNPTKMNSIQEAGVPFRNPAVSTDNVIFIIQQKNLSRQTTIVFQHFILRLLIGPSAMAVNELVSSTRQFVDELENYRMEWESATHWYARKTFLRHNWDSFEDKQRLICLSNAWANVGFMGNKYPEKVMLQLRTMEKGIPTAIELLREAEIKNIYQ
ncbi:unnamed protein product [Clavelina lepadiformis]|uniref:XRN2-binding (XTBD) domain-containing protein n=1 Tax=Clavelina lepadiformis TaxID=159417 RepID=A0ABP0G9T4_CLALP